MNNSLQFLKLGALAVVVAVCVTLGCFYLQKGNGMASDSTGALMTAVGNVDDSELMSYDRRKISGSQAVELLNVYGLKYPVMITTSQITTGFYSIDRIAFEHSDQYVQPMYQFTLEVVKDSSEDVLIILVTQDGLPRVNYDLDVARQEHEKTVTTKYKVITKQYEVYQRNKKLKQSTENLCREGMASVQNAGQNAGSAKYWNSLRAGLSQSLNSVRKEVSARLYNLF